jgi:acyl transferase domain-containing protein
MGRDAYALNPVFRARFDETDALFRPLASLSDQPASGRNRASVSSKRARKTGLRA